jgi:hypothetical protein
MLAEITNYIEEGEKLLSKADGMLGPEDLVVNKLKTAMSVYKNAFDDITSFIEKGKIIEEFQPAGPIKVANSALRLPITFKESIDLRREYRLQ